MRCSKATLYGWCVCMCVCVLHTNCCRPITVCRVAVALHDFYVLQQPPKPPRTTTNHQPQYIVKHVQMLNNVGRHVESARYSQLLKVSERLVRAVCTCARVRAGGCTCGHAR